MLLRKKQKEMIEIVESQEQKQSLRYHFDDLMLREGKLYLRGWYVSYDGPVTVRLMDAGGKEIPWGDWSLQSRPDLESVFPEENALRQGFVAETARKDIPGSRIQVVFANASEVKTKEIGMRQFDCENTRAGRLFTLLKSGGKQKNLELLREYGLQTYLGYLEEETLEETERYPFYARQKAPSGKELAAQREENLQWAPLFSVAAVIGDSPLSELIRFVESVKAQSYGNWQLCLADVRTSPEVSDCLAAYAKGDRRILCRHLPSVKTRAQAWNEALALTEGEYITFGEADGAFTPDALYEAAKYACRYRGTELFYADEDRTDSEGKPVEPLFKPDFDVDYLCSRNYAGHPVFLKKSLLDRTGGMEPRYEGAEEYDLMLRCSEQTEKTGHIPRVLYHGSCEKAAFLRQQGRMEPDPEAGKKALLTHYERLGCAAEVRVSVEAPVFETLYRIQGEPLVSILIPNKDHAEDLKKCIASVEEKSTWKNKELLILENNSTEPETFAFYDTLEKQYDNLRIVRYEGSFNYSAINNLGAAFARGDYLLLLNNDTEVITPDWIERMLGYCQRPDTAAAGARLLYPDGTLQHGGVVLGIGGVAGHTDLGCRESFTGMLDHIAAARQVSVVTGACMMVKKSDFEAVGGLDETLQVAFNDVDFCLKLRETGKKIVYVPSARLYHYESKSRGYENTPEKIRRFQDEIRIVSERHRKALAAGDPFYNPNLTLEKNDCSPARLFDLKEKPDEKEPTDDRGEGTVQPA